MLIVQDGILGQRVCTPAHRYVYQGDFGKILEDIEKGEIPCGSGQPFPVEFDNPELFNRMMEAHIAAILSYVNTNVIEPGVEPFTEETVSWDYVLAEFDWPDSFLVS